MKSNAIQRLLLAAVLTSALAAPLAAQTPAPQFKGIWEPASYGEDLELLDVFFVNVDVGWASGRAGTIVHTKDGGKSWEAQLGGDPANRADNITHLRFLDERTGWAVQRHKLLHTRDGEDWEEIGSVPNNMADFAFISDREGVLAGFAGQIGSGSPDIFRTTDGGRTWKPVWKCSAKVVVAGLTRNIGCVVKSFQFINAQVGYAMLGTHCVGMGCGPPPLIARTEDGGETWRAMVGPGVVEEDRVSALFFLDEQTGFVRLASGKLHLTRDGGETWRGIVASPGEWLRFADPTVGWAYNFQNNTLAYSTDGGARWNARPLRFPARVRAFSFPRRDRAYAVGDHGMIYRYRVVPAAQALKANEIAAPAMPGFTSQLDQQADQLEEVVKEMSAALGVPANAAAKSVSSAVGGATGSTEALDAPLPAASEFMARCCAKSFSRLEVVIGTIAQSLPQLSGQFRNLNLLAASVRMSSDLSSQYRTVKAGLRAFRGAADKDAAAAALSQVSAALGTFKQTTAVVLQKELPPPGEQ